MRRPTTRMSLRGMWASTETSAARCEYGNLAIEAAARVDGSDVLRSVTSETRYPDVVVRTRSIPRFRSRSARRTTTELGEPAEILGVVSSVIERILRPSRIGCLPAPWHVMINSVSQICSRFITPRLYHALSQSVITDRSGESCAARLCGPASPRRARCPGRAPRSA